MSDTPDLDHIRKTFALSRDYEQDSERHALEEISPRGFTIRHPPPPHELHDFITPDTKLFHTIHMGAAVVPVEGWRLVIDGLVAYPLSLTFSQLKSLPTTTVTSFHECYGSPLKPPVTPLCRIGNIRWTGVRLSTLLAVAQPTPVDVDSAYVWSDGLEHGTFAHITADRYQKDLPLSKALQSEVLLGYALNGEPLTKERGFPVRLVVPGWFGTNSTKWICRLSVRERRAPGPYTTELYNETNPEDPSGKTRRPVWAAGVNSMICSPEPGVVIDRRKSHGTVRVWGRAWGSEEVTRVVVKIHPRANRAGDGHWVDAPVAARKEYEWQFWEVTLELPPPALVTDGRSGADASEHTQLSHTYEITARATDTSGREQPMSGRRNHVHSVHVKVR